jgi:hypothetical protein
MRKSITTHPESFALPLSFLVMGTESSGRLDDPNITIVPPDWEVYIQQVADQIISEQSPQR